MFTDVNFPMSNLDLSPYLSPELAGAQGGGSTPGLSYLYDLVAVTHHSGTLNGGHYIAHVDTTDSVSASDSNSQNWTCFNDSKVTPTSSASIGGPSAYILFYRLKPYPTPTEVVV
jgi:ubiquitin C-terminal hydrolase